MEVVEITGSRASSNVFIIVDEKIVVIDSGNGSNFEKIEENLKNHGVSIEDVDILINTHHHFDHIGGNQRIIQKSRCDLMASSSTSKYIEEGDDEKTLASRFGSSIKPLKVSRVLYDGDKISFGDSYLEVITTPGHTDGDICLFEPRDNLLFSGDTIFKRGIGRLDLPTAKPEMMVNSIEKLLELEVEKIYPGHGEVVNKKGNEFIKRALRMAKNF